MVDRGVFSPKNAPREEMIGEEIFESLILHIRECCIVIWSSIVLVPGKMKLHFKDFKMSNQSFIEFIKRVK